MGAKTAVVHRQLIKSTSTPTSENVAHPSLSLVRAVQSLHITFHSKFKLLIPWQRECHMTYSKTKIEITFEILDKLLLKYFSKCSGRNWSWYSTPFQIMVRMLLIICWGYICCFIRKKCINTRPLSPKFQRPIRVIQTAFRFFQIESIFHKERNSYVINLINS